MWIPRRPLESGTIRGRLLGSLVVLALLPIVVLVASWYLLGRTRDDARRIDLAGSLRTGGFVIASQLNSDLASPAEWKRIIVQDELVRMHRTLDALEHGSEELGVGAVRAPELRERLADARHALELYEEVTTRVYAEFDRGALGPAAREEASQEVLGSAYGLFAITNRTAESLEAHTTAALGQLRFFQAAAVVAALLVALATLWAVQRIVLGPIPSLLAAFSELRHGIYGVKVDVRGENEFSHLARAFNAMSVEIERANYALVMKQAEILDKNAELDRASKLKSEFVANMSHELRTPLNAVIGYTRLLRMGAYGPLPDQTREPLEGVDETSHALLQLINDILDVAKIEAGKMDLHLETFRVEDVLHEAEELLRPLAITKGLELRVLDDATVPNVTLDRDKVRRILLNLGGNAIKFTPRGTVELRLLPAREGFFEIAVRDTGIGIAREHLEIVFEDFRQIDGSSSREHGGTGLGLAISRRLARHLGGELRVESELGVGSTFTLRLPVFVHVDGGVARAAGTSATG